MSSAQADVTVRQSLTLRFSPWVPQAVQQQILATGNDVLPTESMLRVKGDRVYVSYGPLGAIIESGRNQVTLLNPRTKRFATLPLSEYLGQFATAQKKVTQPTEVRQALQNLHVEARTQKTGRADTIKGIRAEESLIVLTVRTPEAQANASTMRMEMRYWIAQGAEIRKLPALKELADFVDEVKQGFDPVRFLHGSIGAMPGFEQLNGALEELMKASNGLVLKVHTGMYIPGLAQMVQLAPEGPPAGFDANAPMVEMDTSVAEISTESIPDSVFAVPASYQAAPLDELIKAVIQVPQQLPAPTGPPAR
ncbi:MAG: hypothetical protein JO323_04860 [Acidobacteriia bacterium]|nr:hypothetical protein [Terriglobia bacterium]